jgi:two-component sensor histidine kinase
MKINLFISFLLIYSGLTFCQNNFELKKQNLIKNYKKPQNKAKQKIAILLELTGHLSQKNNTLKEFLVYYKELEELAYNNKSYDDLAEAYIIIAKMYVAIDQTKTLSYYHKAIDLFKSTNNKKGIGEIYGFMAGIYDSRGDYTKSIETHKKSLKILEQINYNRLYANYFNYAEVLYNVDSLKASSMYLKKALKLCEHHNSHWKFFVKFSIYRNNFKSGNYKTTLTDFENLILNMEKFESFLGTDNGNAFYYLAKTYEIICLIKLEKREKALQLLSKLDNEDFSNIRLLNKIEIFDNIHKAYNDLKLYKKAYETLQISANFQSDLIIQNKEENFKKRLILYEVGEKDSQIKKQKEDLKLSKNILILLSIIFILCLIILMIYRTYIKKITHQSHIITNQKENLEKALNDQIILQKELNHRVKNNLQIISSILSLSELKNTADTKIIDKIKNIELRIESIAILHKELSMVNSINQVNLDSYLKNVIGLILNTYGITKSDLKLRIKISDTYFGSKTALTLGLLINELIANSIKHSTQNNGDIYISLNEIETNNYELLYSDGDKAYFTEEGKGLGQLLITHFVETLHGVASYGFKGKRFAFSLKFSEK